MRLSIFVRLAGVAGLAASAACAGDGPTAALAPMSGSGPAMARSGLETTNVAEGVVLTIDPTETRVYRFGQNWVYVPANAVCAPGSSYGPSEWEKPCDLATEPVQVTVTVSKDAEGRPVARFAPDLRFAPTSNPYHAVYLGLKVQGRLQADGYGILYQPTGSDEWIDEAATDPSLRAWRAPGNVIARRLKHFSGYNVSLGYTEQTPQLTLGGY